jgi:two-component system sensor histidine kinase BaeS
MTMRISYKMVMVFLVTTVCSIVLVVASNRYFSLWNHEEHIRQKLDESLILLADSLVDEYENNYGWRFLTDYPKNWELFVQPDQASENTDFLAVNADSGLLFRVKDLAQTGAGDPEALLIPPHSFSLYGAEKELIAGAESDFEESRKVEIKHKGDTVGWLGVNYELQFPTLDKGLMDRLSTIINIFGVVLFLVSTVVVFFFSKHLLSPIQQLSNATKALTDRNFHVRIPVKRKDELGVLAMRFNTMARQLQEYDRNQRQWISDISHELRTPLAVLTGELEALEDGILTLDKATLSSLREEAKSLRRIVEDLHFISLAEAGEVQMERRELKPLPVLTQVICFFENRLKKSDMSITVDLDPNAADLKIAGDQVRLKQVFSNLIENALRYADKPGRLTIRQHQAAGRLLILFEDSGPGVPEHALSNLFERMYRAEPSRSRKTGGSGLGLAICKAIIDAHKGDIGAANSESGGLRIEISLPLLDHGSDGKGDTERNGNDNRQKNTDRRG